MPNTRSSSGCNLSGCLAVLLFNVTIGAISVDYSLWFLFGKSIPWYLAVVFGFLLGEISAPVALICLLLRMAGVHHPLLG